MCEILTFAIHFFLNTWGSLKDEGNSKSIFDLLLGERLEAQSGEGLWPFEHLIKSVIIPHCRFKVRKYLHLELFHQSLQCYLPIPSGLLQG